ncbi:interleukin-4 receptor subunit alpha [Erythrolamprus reginae]|uniref:interleukin-4 receptor subunit alpha n=1 Tax=Erythrolamprus reginae TaxID=121349 RepID=UPI00396CAEA1
MGAWRIAAAAVGLLGLLWQLASSKNVQPTCNNDFDTQLVCHWNVDAVTNCTAEFRLLYQYSTNFSGQLQECHLKNEQGQDAASRCVCVIPEKKFKNVKYNISLAWMENDGKTVWSNRTLDMVSIVKPKPLIHLRVEKKKEDRTFILTWKRNYTEIFRSSSAAYQVAYWPKNHTEQKIIVPEDSSRHTIFADKLRPDSTYEASVRYQLKLWGKIWSEWSAPCEWHNDFEPSSKKISWKYVVCLCVITTICLIVFCYLFFLWMKKKWWDVIPSPRKSKMAEEITAGKWFRIFGKMETVPCRRPFPSKAGADLPHQPLSVNREPFLIPEEVSLSEGSLTTDGSARGLKPGSPEEEAEEKAEQAPHEGAVAGLFRDLLQGTLGVGDPGAPATSGQSWFTPEKPVLLQGFCQPAYQACRVEPEGFGLEPPLPGPGPYAPEGHSGWLPGPESSPSDSSCTALPPAETGPAAPSGYKSFSSLEAQPVSSVCPAWSPWPCLAQEGQSQQAWGSTGPGLLPLSGTSGGFPAGPEAFSHYGAAAPGMWLFAGQQGEALKGGGGPEGLPDPKAAFFSSYRAFSSALQGGLASPELSVEPV